MKKVSINVALLASVMVCLIFLSSCSMIFLSSCSISQWYPTEGAWYCDELQIQLGFDSSCENFFVKDGEKINSAWDGELGSKYIGIACRQKDCQYCRRGTCILTIEWIDLTETQLVVKSTDGVYYIFERVQ